MGSAFGLARSCRDAVAASEIAICRRQSGIFEQRWRPALWRCRAPRSWILPRSRRALDAARRGLVDIAERCRKSESAIAAMIRPAEDSPPQGTRRRRSAWHGLTTSRSCRALRWSQNMRHPSVEGRAVTMVERSKGVNLRAQRIDHRTGDQTPPARPGDRKHRRRSRTALAPALVSFTPGWSICRKAEGIFFGSRYPIRIRSTLRRALSNS